MRISILTRIYLVTQVICVIALVPLFVFVEWQLDYKILFALGVVIVCLLFVKLLLKDFSLGLEALESGLLNLKDGEFSTSINYQKKDQLGRMCDLFNQTIDKLRVEKRWIYQRELLLDKVTQSSPSALFLVNDQGQVVFSNIAAKHFFRMPKGVEGWYLDDLYEYAPKGAKAAIDQGKEGLFSLVMKDKEAETWHMAMGDFLLNNQQHKLYILKQMTRELSRQEVVVWKKVIRVISHELNNSLGPISSMLHSGRILSLKVDEDRLARVFETIDERIKHLSDFVQGYGKFAKIPEPKITSVDCDLLFSKLRQQWEFVYVNQSVEHIQADPAQLEQLLINLLKNAHESESLADKIMIEVSQRANELIIEVSDKGKGIDESRLNNVLIPFYSTKSTGSGLGLALCREIVDAHHGSIALHNLDEGGLLVRITLPIIE